MVIASELRHLLGVDIVPIFALLFAQMAASCVSMSVALRDAADGKQVRPLSGPNSSKICLAKSRVRTPC